MARAMKDSGIEWIGKIPEEWDACRFKDVALLYTGNSIKDEEKQYYEDVENAHPYIATKDVEATFQTVNYSNGLYIKNDDLSFKTASAGSTLMCIEGGSAGKKKAYINQEVSFVNKLCCFKSKPHCVNDKYLFYYVCTPAYEEEFFRNISGLIGGVSVSILKTIPLILPPKEEQLKIANFLDSKCASIDAVIEKTKASIEEYKKLKRAIIIKSVTRGISVNQPMKDSKIPWIKEIPFDWEECRIKNVIFPQEKLVNQEDEIITCYRNGEVTLRKNRREDGYTISLSENGYHGVDVGDLVIHGMDAFAGAIGCSDSRGKVTPVVHVCHTKGNNRYFMYYLRTMAYGNILMDLANGVRIRSSDYRNFAKLGVFEICVPTIKEQDEIVEYLDSKCAEIDALITKKRDILEELENYKKALIFECVTGKREIVP